MASHATLQSLLVLTWLSLTAANEVARADPGSPDAQTFLHQHSSYINRKLLVHPHDLVNHGSWYERHHMLAQSVSEGSPHILHSATSASMSASVIRGPKPIVAIPSARSSYHSSSLHILAMTETTKTHNDAMTETIEKNDDDVSWDTDTERACISAIDRTASFVSNPSGTVACYNVQTLDHLNGNFRADLRVYQVTTPVIEWRRPGVEGFAIALNYAHANITQQNRAIVKREDGRTWRGADLEEARHLYRTRSIRSAPPRFGVLILTGKVDEDAHSQLDNNTSAYMLLSPQIMFSASRADDATIETPLSLQDASFVNGLFMRQRETDNSTIVEVSSNATEIDTLIANFNAVAGSPIGLIVACIYAVLITAISAYGVVCMLKARNAYRCAVNEGKAVGPTVISWQ